nr:MAG TPA: hypothetical protein [Siphoviridae sp. ctDlU28]
MTSFFASCFSLQLPMSQINVVNNNKGMNLV